MLIKVRATFLNTTSAPLTGVRVKLFDKDVLQDDVLGEGTPDEHGLVELICNLGDAMSADSPLETKPDLYFVVTEGGKERFRTPVEMNVNFSQVDPVTHEMNARTVDLGVFRG